MKPDIGIDADDVAAEIARLKGSYQGKELRLSPEALDALIRMKEAGIFMRDIEAYFKTRGWPGCEKTLLKVYREAKK
jgi:hypothetical protein